MASGGLGLGAGSSEERERRQGSLAGKLVSWAITFVMVNLGWAFFCMDLPTSMFFLRRLFAG